MTPDQQAVISSSRQSNSGYWMFAVTMLSGIFLFLVFITPNLGWGQPNAEQLVAAHVKNGPTIVFTNNYLNCGAGANSGGCFSPHTPDKLYVSPDMTYPIMKYVVLHELTHYVQNRDGRPLDECSADAQAKKWGADISHSGYKNRCAAGMNKP